MESTADGKQDNVAATTPKWNHDLRQFQLKRVLNEDSYSKTLFLLGTLPCQSVAGLKPVDALLIVEKLHFSPTEIERFTNQRLIQTHTVGQNDVYHWLKGKIGHQLTSETTAYLISVNDSNDDDSKTTARGEVVEYDWWDVKMTVVYPATEAHIRKYTYQERRMIRETAAIYSAVIEPYIASLSTARIQWVYNILEGSHEQESIIYRDNDPETGFVLIPDSKWDGQTIESLYLLTLCQDRSIRSLRDLRAQHLPLLRNMRNNILKSALERFNVPAHQLRLFFHYQPTYYHLHVHVTHIRNDKLGGMTVGQSYLLDNVISSLNLEKHHAVVSVDPIETAAKS
ncbi:HIT-like domain-containing protein [Syncephalis fuscata]|nr:HIT-like domain-containing protein [Syncephalis fuscata]